MNKPVKHKVSTAELLSDLGVDHIEYAPSEKRIQSILEGCGGDRNYFDRIVQAFNGHFEGNMLSIINAIDLMRLMDEDPVVGQYIVEAIIKDVAKGGHKYHLAILRGIMSKCYSPNSPLVQHVPKEARPLLEAFLPENSRKLITDELWQVYEDPSMKRIVHLSYSDMNMWQRDIALIDGTGNPRDLKFQKRKIERQNRDKESGHLRDATVYVVGGRYGAHDLISKAVEVATHRSAEHELDDTIEMMVNSLKKLRSHRIKVKKRNK